MMEPPAIFLFDTILEKPVYHDCYNCDVIAPRIITKYGLNFFELTSFTNSPHESLQSSKIIIT